MSTKKQTAFRYLAMDPGKMTGFALYDSQDQAHTSFELPYLEAGRYLRNEMSLYLPGHLVTISEKFFYTAATAKKSPGDWSMKLIGHMELTAFEFNFAEPVMQAPGDAKKLATNDRLKALGWFKGSAKGYAGHADDASRHLLAYLVKNRIIDPRKLAAI